LSALGNPVRWQAVKRLAGGAALSASQVASALKRDFDGVSKHLRVLRAAGVVASRPGEDQRFELYYIPATFRPQPGVVDYGFCLLRFPVG
jgi:DNA-binding transcriptional ArsR family regulator